MGRRSTGRLTAALACVVLGVAWTIGAGQTGGGGAATAGAGRLEAFSGLPEFKGAVSTGPARISVGGEGVAPNAGVGLRAGTGGTVAILGDLAPGDGSTDKYLAAAVGQLNLLRPDMVLTTGNLIPAVSRDGRRYAAEALRLRHALDGLRMPWYACAGETDVVSGVRVDAGGGGGGGVDRRFEQLYQTYWGPLYYSVNAGDIHAIVLDSEEGAGVGNAISDGQLRWLKEDLNRTFEGKAAGPNGARAQWVIVVLHRPLWRVKDSNWDRVHDLLVEFNRRPIVNLEGMGGGGDGAAAQARGPRVAAVFAGGERAYAQEPVADGIRYYVVGPTAGMPRLGEDAGETLRHVMVLKFDAAGVGNGAGGGMHPAILQLGAPVGGGDALLPDDAITARERAVIDAIAAWGDDVMGVDGMIDEHGEPVGKKLHLNLSNPLADDIDLQFRLASTRYLGPPARREVANMTAEGFDLPWELNSSHMIRHMAPGKKEGWDISLDRPEKFEMALESAPPQLEIAVHWNDPRGRVHEIILKRRITVVPHVDVVVSPTALRAETEEAWGKAAGGSLYAWRLRGDEPKKVSPSWQMAADDQRIYARVRVDDAVHSYWPRLGLDGNLGGIASDAVSFAWAKGTPGNETVQRVWVLPFGPTPVAATRPGPVGPSLYINTGSGNRQSELKPLDRALDVQASVQVEESGYVVTLSLPRKLIQSDQAPAAATSPATQPTRPVLGTVLLNLAVHDNDEGVRTWTRSLANEEAGPAGWARVQLLGPMPATAPATSPGLVFPIFRFP